MFRLIPSLLIALALNHAAMAAEPVKPVVPVVEASAPTPAPAPSRQPPQFYDYSANQTSDVFGANLFTAGLPLQQAHEDLPHAPLGGT